ncbi:MAG: hypothetical protein GYA59_07235, partial [Chloroflexi bacterium]|nr:hypothetical protein [Chloroflexota bacterium]
ATKRMRAGAEAFALKAGETVVGVSLVLDGLALWAKVKTKKQPAKRKRAKKA